MIECDGHDSIQSQFAKFVKNHKFHYNYTIEGETKKIYLLKIQLYCQSARLR